MHMLQQFNMITFVENAFITFVVAVMSMSVNKPFEVYKFS